MHKIIDQSTLIFVKSPEITDEFKNHALLKICLLTALKIHPQPLFTYSRNLLHCSIF